MKKKWNSPQLEQLSVSKTANKPNPTKTAGSTEGHVTGTIYHYIQNGS